MYTQHWKLSCRPFENRCDAAFYYPAELHQAAVLKLHYTIENRRAAGLLCGPTGVGKTFLIQALRKQLSLPFQAVTNLVFPALDQTQWLCYFADAVDAAHSGNSTTTATALSRFEKALLSSIDAKTHPTVIVDEAHLLEQYDLLEPLRLMLNVAADRAPGEAAWTLVLVGQEITMAQVERYQALDERLAVKCLVGRMKPEETLSYIQHRLRVAHGDASQIFEPAALEAIECLSQGLPRRINRLCDLALMIGYAEEMHRVSAEVIDSVHADLAAPL
ncbi:MAG: AAA family ATPase [Pirellulaceae bacterium]|nr:AAA family ATPase [Pirellulaceae bacterium]